MKSVLKHIGLLTLAALAFASCIKRADPEEQIVNYFNMPRCMKPVQVKTEVENNTVTLRLKVFNDAEKYLLEVYNSVIYEDWEPTEEEREDLLVESFEIPSDEIPFTFTTLEDVTLYYRVCAVNERAGREQSYWTVNKFKTSVNPATTCLTLEPEVNSYFELIKFFWQPRENEEYTLEIYNEAIPSSGEPDEANLYKTLTLQNEDIPYSEMFPIKEGSYYYRVKAKDKLGVRKDSKWTKGSFKVTELFAWPTADTSFDFGVDAGVTKTADITSGDPFGVASGKQFSADKTVDNITWKSKGYWYTGSPCYMMYNRVKNWENLPTADWASNESIKLRVPTDSGLSFSINRPGTFHMDIRVAFASTPYSRHNVYVLIGIPLGGKKMLSTLYNVIPPEDQFTYPTKFDVTFEVTKDMLFGMEGPATIYIWHEAISGEKALQFNYYAPTWTPSL